MSLRARRLPPYVPQRQRHRCPPHHRSRLAPNSMPRPTPSTRRAAICSRPSARRRTSSLRRRSTRFPAATTPRSRESYCRLREVSQDSAASGLLHVRNDHANVQFRINGVMLPDGLTGFGSILDASWIGSIALIVARSLPNTDCAPSASLTSRPAPTFSITAVKSAFTAAAKERSRRQFNTAAPSAAPVRPYPHRRPAPGRCPVRIAFQVSNISSPAVTCKPRKASRIRPPPTARSMTSRNREKASPICRHSSTPTRASA